MLHRNIDAPVSDYLISTIQNKPFVLNPFFSSLFLYSLFK